MSAIPVVGVSAYDAQASWGEWDAPAVLAPMSYCAALMDAGAAPVVIPLGAEIERIVERIDGLVLIGGPDVDPARYGEEPHALTKPSRSNRDDFEIALFRASEHYSLPVLAICRGLQVLNVARGGTLHQHVPEVVGHDKHAPSPGTYGRTTVRTVAGTLLAGILGAEPLDVDCAHHQSIKVIGTGLSVAAHSGDGTIEAVEDASERFVVGLQWHPEVGHDPRVVRAFVKECSDDKR